MAQTQTVKTGKRAKSYEWPDSVAPKLGVKGPGDRSETFRSLWECIDAHWDRLDAPESPERQSLIEDIFSTFYAKTVERKAKDKDLRDKLDAYREFHGKQGETVPSGLQKDGKPVPAKVHLFSLECLSCGKSLPKVSVPRIGAIKSVGNAPTEALANEFANREEETIEMMRSKGATKNDIEAYRIAMKFFRAQGAK